MKQIKVKRIYDTVEQGDGVRILVDRLWPRGIKSSEAQIDLWLKDIAPSNELREFFAHDRRKWPEFKQRYQEELKGKKDFLTKINNELSKGNITLLYGAKDTACNNAMALKEYLEQSTS